MKTLLLSLLLVPCGLLLSAADRVALVIGNNHYKELPERMQLTSPVDDATDVASALKALGYTLVTGKAVTDGTRETITSVTEKFATAAKGAEAAVFYYSGHGVQVGDDNYLLPTDTPKLNGISMLKNRGVLLRDSVMVALEEAGAKNKIIILDCCRDNPFSAQLEAALSQVGKSIKTKSVGEITGYGPGFYLAFATSPGQTAADGNGARNSPFTAAMLRTLPTSASKDIDFFFRDVKSILPDDQVSWTNHSIKGSFSLGTMPLISGGAVPMPDDYASLAGRTAGERKLIEIAPGVSIPFRWCPPGTFTMGSPASEQAKLKAAGVAESIFASETQHSVSLSKGFWLAETEVTQGHWQAVMGTTLLQQANKMLADDTVYKSLGDKTLRAFKGAQKGEGSKHIGVESEKVAMYNVNWEEADEFCTKASRHAGQRGWAIALPTEAQWEYACRSGTSGMTYAGDFSIKGENNAPGLDAIAWYGGNSSEGYSGTRWSTASWKEKQYPGGTGGPRRVGSKQANEWGLRDMIGNVWEWCADYYGPYATSSATDPQGATKGDLRVFRGGSWSDGAADCRAAYRFSIEPGHRSISLGFRPALVPSR